MKKLALFAALIFMCSAGFSQGLKTSLKDANFLDNSSKAMFTENTTYFYMLSDQNVKIAKTEGVFKVADFYEVNSPTAGEPQDEYQGEVAFTFATVLTEQGYALKIDSKVTNRDGVNLKGATLEVKEDNLGVSVSFKVKGTFTQKTEKGKSFQVLTH